jgi:hypothetical protein
MLTNEITTLSIDITSAGTSTSIDRDRFAIWVDFGHKIPRFGMK